MVPELSASRRKRVMLFIFLTILLDMIGIGIIIPVTPQLLQDVGHVDLATAAKIGGWMFAAYSVAQFLFGPVMGNLADAFGRRPLLLIAIGGLAVDYVFSALAPSLPYLFAGRIIAGVCGASFVIANAIIADITPPEERAGAFGLMGAAFGVGFIIGPAIGGLLGEFGARVPFWAAAAFSAANLALGWFVMPETLDPDHRRRFDWRRANPFGALKVFRSYPTVLPLSIVLTMFFFASSVYPATWPFWGKMRFGWSEGMIGLTLAAFGIIQAFTQGFLSGRLAKWWGEGRVALFGLVMACVAAAGYGVAGSFAVVIVLIVMHGPEGLIHPMISALMSREVPGNAQGELQGGMSSLSNLAMLVGTLFYTQLFGIVMADGAPVSRAGIPFVVAAAILLLTLFFYVFARRRTAAAH